MTNILLLRFAGLEIMFSTQKCLNAQFYFSHFSWALCTNATTVKIPRPVTTNHCPTLPHDRCSIITIDTKLSDTSSDKLTCDVLAKLVLNRRDEAAYALRHIIGGSRHDADNLLLLLKKAAYQMEIIEITKHSPIIISSLHAATCPLSRLPIHQKIH